MSQKFDKESVYDEKISPLMTEIIAICKEHEIQNLCTFFLKEKEEDEADGSMICTTYLEFPKVPCSSKIKEAYSHVISKPFVMSMTIGTRQ